MGVAEEPQGMAEIMAIVNEGLHPAVDLILVTRKVTGDKIAMLEGVPPRRKEPEEERVGPEGMLLLEERMVYSGARLTIGGGCLATNEARGAKTRRRRVGSTNQRSSRAIVVL
jgi:hypothetical protein